MEVCNHFCEITVKFCSGLPILAMKTNHRAAQLFQIITYIFKGSQITFLFTEVVIIIISEH